MPALLRYYSTASCVLCAAGGFTVLSGSVVGVVFSGWCRISCREGPCSRRLGGCLGLLLYVCKISPGCSSVGPFSYVVGSA
jgi:hypothetical protein